MNFHPSSRAGLSRRVYRYTRVGVHVFQGLAITLLFFPLLSLAGRRRLVEKWSSQLLSMMNVKKRLKGFPQDRLPGNVIMVANHISWLDIFVLNSTQAARFVAKKEMRKWPLVGLLVASCGTLFIERENRRDARRINDRISEVLVQGDCVAIFPEATTSDGTSVLPFHGSLLQPVVEAQGAVQPIAIRYHNGHGQRSESPVYIGQTNLLQSIWRIVSERELHVEVVFLPLLAAQGKHRRELAQDAHNRITQVLHGSAPEQELERHDDLQDAQPKAFHPTHSRYPTSAN